MSRLWADAGPIARAMPWMAAACALLTAPARAQPAEGDGLTRWVRAPAYLHPEHVGLYLDADLRPLAGADVSSPSSASTRPGPGDLRTLFAIADGAELTANVRAWRSPPLVEAGAWARCFAVLRVARIESVEWIEATRTSPPVGAEWEVAAIAVGRMVEARIVRERPWRDGELNEALGSRGTSLARWAAEHGATVTVDAIGLRPRTGVHFRDVPTPLTFSAVSMSSRLEAARPILMRLRRIPPGTARTPALPAPAQTAFVVRIELDSVVLGPPTTSDTHIAVAVGTAPERAALFESGHGLPGLLFRVPSRRAEGGRRDFVLERRAAPESGAPTDRYLLRSDLWLQVEERSGSEHRVHQGRVRFADVCAALFRLDGIIEVTTTSGARVVIHVERAEEE